MTEIVGILAVFVTPAVFVVLVVWLVNRTRQNEANRKAEIALKAIESGAPIDANIFKENRTIKERLLKRLTSGCIWSSLGIVLIIIGLINKTEGVVTGAFILGGLCLAIGISLCLMFFVSKNMLAKEIEAEEKAFEQK